MSKQDKQKQAFVFVVVIMFFLFLVIGIVSLITKEGYVINKRQITAEQFQKVRVGDFIFSKKRTGFWCPVKQKGDRWITIRIIGDTFSLDKSEIDSVIFAPRDMDGNKWQKMALEYLAMH